LGCKNKEKIEMWAKKSLPQAGACGPGDYSCSTLWKSCWKSSP
jgi:hypothetical protein